MKSKNIDYDMKYFVMARAALLTGVRIRNEVAAAYLIEQLFKEKIINVETYERAVKVLEVAEYAE